MKTILAIILTVFVNIFLYFGYLLISNRNNKNKDMLVFTRSLALIVFILLSIHHIFPLAVKLLSKKLIITQTYALIVLLTIIIYVIFKILEPHISFKYGSKLGTKSVLYLNIVLIFIFNLVEGFNIYTNMLHSYREGIMCAIIVCIHNLLFGMILAGEFSKESKKEKVSVYTCISCATIIGTLIGYVFGTAAFDCFTFGIIESIVFGLIVYLIFFKLINYYRKESNKKFKVLGILIGGLLILFSTLI